MDTEYNDTMGGDLITWDLICRSDEDIVSPVKFEDESFTG